MARSGGIAGQPARAASSFLVTVAAAVTVGTVGAGATTLRTVGAPAGAPELMGAPVLPALVATALYGGAKRRVRGL